MLFAEKARVPPKVVTPECIIIEDDAAHSDAANVESGSPVPGSELSPVSVKITISESGKSRRQQGAAKRKHRYTSLHPFLQCFTSLFSIDLFHHLFVLVVDEFLFVSCLQPCRMLERTRWLGSWTQEKGAALFHYT